MKTTIFVPDIECDSCIRILDKKFKTLKGIEKYNIKEDSIEFIYKEDAIKVQDIVNAILNSGFRASLDPFERKTFKERWRDFKDNSDKYSLERKGIKYAIATFSILIVLEIIAYFTFLKNIPDFTTTYGWWIFYLTVSTVFLGFALWHVQSYKVRVTCMVGMMIGMTFGMQTGMMMGAIMGATNGFFVGASVGMILGVFVGAWTGTCCGVMGVMEGMMAGIMGELWGL